MSGVDKDLATLSFVLADYRSDRGQMALGRVEAELSRLREERDATMRSYDSCLGTLKKAVETAEAMEARCARLQQALREFFDEWDGDVGTYAPTDDTEALMREALAGLDTPADSQEIRSYGFDGYGRAYARYANGEVMPTGYVARSFAGKSDVTPERYAEIAADARAKPADSQEDGEVRAVSQPEDGTA